MAKPVRNSGAKRGNASAPKAGPYAEYLSCPEYSLLDKAIDDLVENKDFVLQTPKAYVVGYLVKALKKGPQSDA